MTYGPEIQWRFPFQEKIELRKPDFRVVFISLCIIAALIVLVSFSYYTSLPVSVTLNQLQEPSQEKLDVIRITTFNATVSHVVVNKEENSDEIIELTAKDIENFELELNINANSLEDGDFESEIQDAEITNITVQEEAVPLTEIDWNDTRLDILNMPKPQYDTRFKNPCWYEQLHTADPYENNTYVPFSPAAERILAKMTEHWEYKLLIDEKPKRLRCLPYFFIIGQPKCGSTDLFWKIAKHPDIETPPIKELHWWSRSRQGRRFFYTKIIPFNDYVDMFDRPAFFIDERLRNITVGEDTVPPDSRQIITGEASVSLFWDNREWMKFPENRGHREPIYIVPHYIHHIIPDAKFIIILRDPVERLYSDYLYFHSTNKSADDFHAAVKLAIRLYSDCIAKYNVRQCVYDTDLSHKVRVRITIGMYCIFLKDWLQLFSQQQFFVLRLEDYSRNTVEYVKQIYQFLEIRFLTTEEEEELLISSELNSRKPEDKLIGGMYEETRALLRRFYRGYNEELAQILGNTKFLWTDMQT